MSDTVSQRKRGALFIGRYFDIEIYLDYSWFIIATILVFTLTTSFFPETDSGPGQTPGIYLAMGLSGALLFSLSILLHELGHSLVSQRCGIAVRRITLLFIGGLAEIAREPDDARSELKIALGGPAVSVLLIGLYAFLWLLFEWLAWAPAAVVALWLAVANTSLVVFNMIPGYPLDGGRVLRALLWARSGRLRQATYISSRIGIGLSWLLIAWGLYSLLLLNHLSSITLLLIAFFLQNAANAGYANALQRETLDSLRVRDLLHVPPIFIPDSLPLNLAIDDFFLAYHQLAFPVCDQDQKFCGLLSLKALQSVPQEKWPYTTACEIAENDDTVFRRIGVEQSASQAQRLLQTPGCCQLAVVDADYLVGMLTRADLAQVIEIRTRLENSPKPRPENSREHRERKESLNF